MIFSTKKIVQIVKKMMYFTFIMSSWLMSKHRSTVKVCPKCATELPLAGSVVALLVTVVPSIWQQSPSSVVQPAGSSTRYLAKYKVINLLVHPGCVDFDVGVPPSCPIAPPNQDLVTGTLKIRVNPIQRQQADGTPCMLVVGH